MLYVDMDGLVADFDGGILKRYGKAMDGLTGAEMDYFWNTGCVADRFFASLQPIQGGIKFVSGLIANGIEFSFLTSTGGGVQHIEIAKQKLDWLHSMGYVNYPVAFCTGTKSKASFASPGCMLFDDRQKVVDAFIEAGGEAFLFVPDEWEEALEAAKSRVDVTALMVEREWHNHEKPPNEQCKDSGEVRGAKCF